MTQELIEKVFAITSFVAAVLTILAIVVAVIVILVTGLRKAKRPDSDGGTSITPEEAKELLFKLLPHAVKLVNGINEIIKKDKSKDNVNNNNSGKIIK